MAGAAPACVDNVRRAWPLLFQAAATKVRSLELIRMLTTTLGLGFCMVLHSKRVKGELGQPLGKAIICRRPISLLLVLSLSLCSQRRQSCAVLSSFLWLSCSVPSFSCSVVSSAYLSSVTNISRSISTNLCVAACCISSPAHVLSRSFPPHISTLFTSFPSH